jgi:hypothetical protein
MIDHPDQLSIELRYRQLTTNSCIYYRIMINLSPLIYTLIAFDIRSSPSNQSFEQNPLGIAQALGSQLGDRVSHRQHSVGAPEFNELLKNLDKKSLGLQHYPRQRLVKPFTFIYTTRVYRKHRSSTIQLSIKTIYSLFYQSLLSLSRDS